MAASIFPVSSLNSAAVKTREHRRPTSPTRNQPDEVLLRAQSGDPDAFSQLYELHNRRVFGICLRMVRDFSVAEDLTQETFLQLYRKLASFRGDSLFTTWLHRMTVNIVLMKLRKRVLPSVSLDQIIEGVVEEKSVRKLGAADRNQTGVVDRLTIERAVNTLPPGYRKFFLLYEVQGLEHREIATLEGCSLGNSKSQLHKARRALQTALASRGRRGLPDRRRAKQPPYAS